MVHIDRDNLEKQLEEDKHRTKSLDKILHSLGILREGLRPQAVKEGVRPVSPPISAPDTSEEIEVANVSDETCSDEGCEWWM